MAVGPRPEAPKDARIWIDFGSMLWVGAWQRVLYSPTTVRRHLERLLEEMPGRRRWSLEASDEEEFIERGQELDADMLGAMTELAVRYKAPGFAGEREYRVTATAAYAATHLHHRAGALGIVAYVELTQAPNADTKLVYNSRPETRTIPIQSVRLGPSLPDEHVHTVRRFLRMNGINVPVTKVDVPLR